MSEEKQQTQISQLRPKTWAVLELAVSNGAERGIRRARKHNDNPTDEDIERHVIECVLGEISEWFHVDSET